MPSPKLSDAEISEQRKQFPNWELHEGKLHRKLEFENFSRAFAFMTEAAMISERLNHHPSWFNEYRVVDIHLCSHDVKGISSRDFKWVEAIEKILSANR